LHRDRVSGTPARGDTPRDFGLFAEFSSLRPCLGIATLATKPPADWNAGRKNRGLALVRGSSGRFRRDGKRGGRNACGVSAYANGIRTRPLFRFFFGFFGPRRRPV